MVGTGNPPDTTNVISIRKLAEGFDGTVEFNIPIFSEDYGSANLAGSYPRIKPKFERKDLDPADLLLMESKMMTWIETHFNVSKNFEYYETIINISILFVAYTDPFAQFWSKQLELCIKLHIWAWTLDDFFERVVAEKITLPKMEEFTSGLVDIMQPNTSTIAIKSPNHPTNKCEQRVNLPCQSFYDSLRDIRNLWLEVIPNYFNECEVISLFEENYYSSCKFYLVTPEAKMCSTRMFQYWRNISFRYDWSAAVNALIHNANPPQDFFKSPAVCRILDISNSYGAMANDILGIKKDIRRRESSVVLYKVRENGITLATAVEEVSEMLREDVEEYVTLRKYILDIYQNDCKVEKFLNILDSLMDGQNRIYGQTKRYDSGSLVQLTRL